MNKKDNPVPSLDFNIIKTATFDEEDEICHIRNFMAGLAYFFEATDYDVEHYSGKNGIYLLKEYGVETNKEQPIDNRCDYCIKHNEPEYGCE